MKLRLEREQPLSFLEFNYMLMQATDFLELHRRFGCTLQMGGSDQWGNIVNGVELVRRMDRAQAFGLTTPLLTTSSGEKMGKTVGGAVWLNADRLSPYDYWQMWRNTEDADVGRFLRLFTDCHWTRLGRLAALRGSEINEAKKLLANEATTMLHGRAAADAAADAARAAAEGRLSQDMPTFRSTDLGTQSGSMAGAGCDSRRLQTGAFDVRSAQENLGRRRPHQRCGCHRRDQGDRVDRPRPGIWCVQSSTREEPKQNRACKARVTSPNPVMAGRKCRPPKNTPRDMAVLWHGHPTMGVHGSPGLTPGDDGLAGSKRPGRLHWPGRS